MNITEKFRKIKENYYLDSLSETDLSEQNADPNSISPEEMASQNPDQIPQMAPPIGQPGLDPNMALPPQGIDPNMPIDPNMAGGAYPGQMDPYAQQPKTITQLGRIYELQKIYTRLQAIHDFLMNEPDCKLEKIRDYVNESFDIFKLVLNNIQSFSANLDDVVLEYNKFISNITILLSKYVKIKKEILNGD